MDEFERVDTPPAGYSDDIPSVTVTCTRCGQQVLKTAVGQHSEFHQLMAKYEG